MAYLAETIEYKLVDDIPDVAMARQAVRLDSLNILETRKQELLQNGESSAALPLPIDALSTARKVLNATHSYGEGSAQQLELMEGLLLDCQRLVAEWYRKKKPEYFPPLRHRFDEQTEDFFSHGLSVSQMTENAIRPIANDPEEEARRINERVEDATPQILRKLGNLAIGKTVRTISECTDKAIHDYGQDQRLKRSHRGYGGYVPEIEKVMIRDINLDQKSNDRLEEQLGLPGLYVNHYVIQKALERRGAAVGHMDKTELHGSQMLVNDDLMDFVKTLDQVASEEWCAEIFMGEAVPEGTVKDYANFREEAIKRQNGLKDLALTVRTFLLDLVVDQVDGKKAPAMVEDFVKRLLLDLGKQDIQVAEQMFDAKTAHGLLEVAYLESIGQFNQAAERMESVMKAAPGGGYCSGGSCGLESINTHSKEGQDLYKKLKAKPGDTLVKDKERSCKCGSRSVVYAYNKNKVNKYCTKCEAFESKIGKAA